MGKRASFYHEQETTVTMDTDEHTAHNDERLCSKTADGIINTDYTYYIFIYNKNNKNKKLLKNCKRCILLHKMPWPSSRQVLTNIFNFLL